MEARKDRMAHEYVPKLHDYVKWHTHNMTHEGWVYYKDDETISIELGTKPKPCCELTADHKHKKTHILLVCQNWNWHQLEYVTSRKDYYDEPFRDRA